MKLRKLAKVRWTVYAVYDDNGACSVLEFIKSLERPMQRKLLAQIQITAQHGPQKYNRQKSRKIQGYKDLYELKCGGKTGTEARILYFYCKGMVVVCTNGFTKAERTPPEDLERAAAIRKQYEQDSADGNITVIGEERDP